MRPIFNISGKIPAFMQSLKYFSRSGLIMCFEHFIIFMGISLDLPLCNSDIIPSISSDVQSWRNILDMQDFGKYSVCSGFTWSLSSEHFLFIFSAIDTKYLLNSLAMTLRLMIFSLLIVNRGLISLFFLPLREFITSHVFFLSPWCSRILLQ